METGSPWLLVVAGWVAEPPTRWAAPAAAQRARQAKVPSDKEAVAQHSLPGEPEDRVGTLLQLRELPE